MPRIIPEWCGRNDNSLIPPRVLLRIFLRFDGRCQCGCDLKIITGQKWQADHKVALINGGEHREMNLQPLLVEHHRNKTRADVAEKARTYKRRLKHAGIKTKRPGFRGWRKFNGDLVYATSKK